MDHFIDHHNARENQHRHRVSLKVWHGVPPLNARARCACDLKLLQDRRLQPPVAKNLYTIQQNEAPVRLFGDGGWEILQP